MSVSPAPRRHNRAKRVGLRTLRQVPKVVGHTPAGDTIFEVRSVRLLLADDAPHFSRIVACSNCGRDVAGPAVLNPGDLDLPTHGLVCRDCVSTASAPALEEQRRRRPFGEAAEPDGVPANRLGTEARAVPPPGDDARLAALEQRMARLADVVDGQHSHLLATLDERAAEARAELTTVSDGTRRLARAQGELGQALQGLARRMDDAAPADARRLEAIERRVDEAVERLTGAVDARAPETDSRLEARLERIEAALEDEAGRARTDLAAVSARGALLERTQNDMGVRLARLTERLAEDAEATDGRLQLLVDRMQALDDTLGEGLGAGPDPALADRTAEATARLAVDLHQRLDHLAEGVARSAVSGRERMEVVEREVREVVDRLALVVESQRADSSRRVEVVEEQAATVGPDGHEPGGVLAALDRAVGELQSEIAAVSMAHKELADGQAEIERRVELLTRLQRAARAEPG